MGIVLALGCHAAATEAPAPPGPKLAIAYRSTDEGVWLRLEGPNDVHYTVLDAALVTDGDGVAKGAVPTRKLTTPLEVTATWKNPSPGERKLTVDYAPSEAPPGVWFGALPSSTDDDYTPSVETDCAGACAGRLSFFDGSADVWVTGTTGCTMKLANKEVTFDTPPEWDPSGRYHRSAKPFSLRGDLDELELPKALQERLKFEGTLACPSRPAAPFTLTVGAGAVVSLLRDRYHAAPLLDEGHTSVLILHGARFLDGMDREHELARFLGAPTNASHVNMIAKVRETPQKPYRTCDVKGETVNVELRSYFIELSDSTGIIGRTTIPAPTLDCSAVATLPAVENQDGDTVRVVRPSNTLVDAFAQRFLKP
jgi:hypothetical protein